MFKKNVFVIFLVPAFVFSQSIEIISFGDNPLVVNPLTGSNLVVNYKYTSETDSSGNHLFIGLEILDQNNNFISYINGKTLENQTAGTNKNGSVSFFVGNSNKTSTDLPTGYYYQAKAILYASGSWTENAWTGYWNTPSLTLETDTNHLFSSNRIAKGADISWMTEMENQGYIWKDNDGNAKELMPLLKEYDLDAIRLRVLVNPENSGANGWCDIDDLLVKAEKAKANNLDIMVCVPYSDWWADPGKQTKPAAWANYSVAQLETAIAEHTTAILSALDAKGITPKWIQIGNETNDGMLWPTGKAFEGNFVNYAKFLNAGANATKRFNSSIKTILHLANSDDNDLYKWNIDGLINNGLQMNAIDIIGMSLYPDENDWIQKVEDTYDNMLAIKTLYRKDVMMVEVGFSNNKPDVSHQFLTYIIEKTKQANGLGVLYWEPIARSPFTDYNKGAWNDDGSPSIVMDAFINKTSLQVNTNKMQNKTLRIFPIPSNKTLYIEKLNGKLEEIEIYDYRGRLIQKLEINKNKFSIDITNFSKGIYVLKINNTEWSRFLKN